MRHFILLAICIALAACNGGNNNECDDCPAACTYDFRFLTIDVKDSEGNPVELKDYNVTVKKTNEALNITFKSSTEGSYVIASDSHMKELACDGTKVEFNYSIDGDSYKTETFLIGKDCCHIQWRDDKAQEIIID